jgi:O-antigen/teichoic acid export membrane protein
LGLNAFVLPRLSDRPQDANKLFNFRLLLSLGLVLIANLVVNFMPFHSPAFNKAVLIGSFSIIASGIFNSCNLIFQKNLRYDRSIIASSLGSLTIIPVVFCLSSINLPAEYLIIGSLLGWITIALLAMLLLNNSLTFNIKKIDLGFAKKLLAAWPISLTLLLNVVYFRIDTFILSKYFSFAEVGIYNLSYQVFQSILVLPTFIMNSFYPILVASHNESQNKFFKQVKISVLLLFVIAIFGSILTYFLSPVIISLIAGQNGFAGSIESLRILSFSFPAFFVSSILMWTMVTLKRYKLMMAIYFLGLLANFFLNLYFIPRYSYIASSWVTGISEYLILVLQIAFLWKASKK